MMRSYKNSGVIFLILLNACASVERRVYQEGMLSREKSYAIVFAYEEGQDETRMNQAGVEIRNVRKGHPDDFLALRDDIKFGLRDAGIKIVSESNSPNVLVQIHPTIRRSDCEITCGSIDTLSVVFLNPSQKDDTVARIKIQNGDRVATTMKENELAKFATNKILEIIGGTR
jgi:hypothetical protein